MRIAWTHVSGTVERDMMSRCEVSIGLPFHNNQGTLADAIRSVYAQSFNNWELILFDDGSKDDSLNIAQSVEDKRVKVVHREQNIGLGNSLNEIAKIASSRYLFRMDADDLMHPERIVKQLSCLINSPEVDLVGSIAYTINRQNNPTGIRGNPINRVSLESILEHGLMVHPTVCGRTDWFRRNPYDESLTKAQDLELWCRTFRLSKFKVLPEALLFYREEADGDTYEKYKKTSVFVRQIARKYGPEGSGRFFTLKLITKTHLKCIIYSLGAAFGLEHRLVSRGADNLENNEKEIAERVIDRILNTPVPGFQRTDVLFVNEA